MDQALVYPGQHCVSAGKRDIYSVEGGNADRRDDSAALARKTRCFARSVPSVRDTRKLVIIGYNQQQLRTFRYPTYHRTLVECVSP